MILALFWSLPAVAQDRDDLAQARARLAELSAELDRAVDDADGAELALDDAQGRLDQVEAVVNQVARRVDEQDELVRGAQDDLDALEAEHAAARAAVQRRAVQLYMNGASGGLFTILQSTDIKAAMERTELLQLLDADDKTVLDRLTTTAARAQGAREVLEAESAVFDELLVEQQLVMDAAEELRDSRALAAAAAASEVDRVEEAHDEAAADAARMEELIRQAEAAAAARAAAARADAARAAARSAAAAAAAATPSTPAADDTPDDTPDDPPATTTSTPEPPPATTGGGYTWPACGPVTSEYGYRWGRLHAGLDIDDTWSSTIVAAQSGTVISAGWNSGGYGNLTLIAHGDGIVTAYAHQASIMVSTGQSVSRGQQIGVIGTTGSSTGTHLHFETRVGGSAVNPRNYLSGGC